MGIQFELDAPVAKSTISIGARKFRSISILTSAVFKLHHTVAVRLCKSTVGDIIFETRVPFRELGYRNTVVGRYITTESRIIRRVFIFVAARNGSWCGRKLSRRGVHISGAIRWRWDGRIHGLE